MNQSKQKLINYLDDYIDSKDFQKKLIKSRKELNIPSEGLSLEGNTEESLFKIMHDCLFVPKEILANNTKMLALAKIRLTIDKLIKDFPIHNKLITYYFRLYLFYNTKIDKGLRDFAIGGDGHKHEDASLCGVGVFSNIRRKNEDFKNLLKEYPVFIKINPYVSQRDLISYIKESWWQIDNTLKSFREGKSRLGKSRTKKEKIKIRNNFIYQNRHLPIKQIFKLVSDKFDEILDDGHIGKIISLEKKRRK